MELYAGIDLHSNNSVLSVLDERDRTVFAKRLPNYLPAIIDALRTCAGTLHGVAVESTFNWYWLVDGLQDEGFPVRLVHTTAVKQYEGLKRSDDFGDARHLAQLMRLGVLPTGYICPREQRAVRDLARKRAQLVRQRTTQILSVQNLMARNLAVNVTGNEIKSWDDEVIDGLPLLEQQGLAVKANLAVLNCLDEQIKKLERAILEQVRLREDYRGLRTVPGIGEILALTIALETGDIGRFEHAGNFASYARMVDSRRESNGKKKGEGNVKSGNRYLAWAFIEAANFAVRYDATINRWYQRKRSRSTLPIVALKAVGHKLARACFYVMRDREEFHVTKSFE
jgi:transposase